VKKERGLVKEVKKRKEKLPGFTNTWITHIMFKCCWLALHMYI